jgi:TrmH family RNA methyltransferase
MLRTDGYRIYANVPDAAARKITTVDFAQASVCIIGNEANGVEPMLLALAEERITIPMAGRAESLNASVAAAITMYNIQKREGQSKA